MRESDNDKCSVTVKKYVGLHLILFAAGLQLSRKNVTVLRIDCKKFGSAAWGSTPVAQKTRKKHEIRSRSVMFGTGREREARFRRVDVVTSVLRVS